MEQEQAHEPTRIVFTAKYRGECAVCNGAINPGDKVTADRKGGKRVHLTPCGDARFTPAATPPSGDVFAMLASALGPHIEAKLKGAVDEEQVRALFEQMANEMPPQGLPKDEVEKMIAGTFETGLERIAKAVEPVVARWAKAEAEKIFAERGTVKLEVTRKETGETIVVENAHESLKTLLYLISKGHHVYLHGPAGSGKSTAAKQAADAFGRKFGYVSLDPQAPRSLVMGFIDANGTYRRTEFRECYENGGVFCIDEMDNASSNLLIALNSALENHHAAFPDAMIQKHEDFVLVATGNTAGRGGDAAFMHRKPFDPAFAERFTYLEWNYDEKMERNAALAINPDAKLWVEWVRKVRAFCREQKIGIVVSPRASFKGADYMLDKTLKAEQIADMVIFKGLDATTRKRVLDSHPLTWAQW